MFTRVILKKIKSLWKEYAMYILEILANDKHFPKSISQYGLLIIKLPRAIVVHDISPSLFKLKRVSYLP